MAMTFERYTGSAEQYVREYLIASTSFEDNRVSSEREARQAWAALEHTFRDDGGTGIDEDTFVGAMLRMYGVKAPEAAGRESR